MQSDDVSTTTKDLDLISKKKVLDPSRNTNTRSEFAADQTAIKESSLQDYKDWVNNRVTEMEAVYTGRQ